MMELQSTEGVEENQRTWKDLWICGDNAGYWWICVDTRGR